MMFSSIFLIIPCFPSSVLIGLFLELEVTSMLLHKRTQRFCIVLLAGKDKEQKIIWVLQV
jgi:hypothetical protein